MKKGTANSNIISDLQIIEADKSHLKELTGLFDAYLAFYGVSSSFDMGYKFMTDRVRLGDSILYLAFINKECVGFTQIYPIFSSTMMKRSWLVNDLFVAQESRHKGVATALLNRAVQLAIETNANGLTLQTGITNFTAQKLYEKFGFEKNLQFFVYDLKV